MFAFATSEATGSKTCQNLPSNLSKPVLKPVAARADYQLAAPLRHGLSIAAATTGFDKELVKRAGELFARGNKAPAVEDAQKVIDDLHRKIGQLQVERDFLAGQPAISRLLRGGR
jgi:hypothetical protein